MRFEIKNENFFFFISHILPDLFYSITTYHKLANASSDYKKQNTKYEIFPVSNLYDEPLNVLLWKPRWTSCSVFFSSNFQTENIFCYQSWAYWNRIKINSTEFVFKKREFTKKKKNVYFRYFMYRWRVSSPVGNF